MKHKLRFSFGVLLLLLLSAGASFAVTVPGHDGTELALTQIPDIIRHVTGKTSGDLSMNKDSLFMYGMKTVNDTDTGVPGAYTEMYEDVYSFNNDGTSNHAASLKIDRVSNPLDDIVYRYSCTLGVHNTSTASDDRGKRMLLLSDKYDNIISYTDFVLRKNDGKVTEVDIEHKADILTPNVLSGFLADTKAGISVKGYDGELAAVCTRNNAEVKLYLSPASNPNDDASKYAYTPHEMWSKTLADVPTMFNGKAYFPVSMAVGDFNNDGYTDEIVVIETDRIAIHYNVLRISHTGSTPQDASFSVSPLTDGEVGRYDYSAGGDQYSDRYKNMDGLSCTYSLCTVAGDFDGDRKTEFAVIYKDTSPQTSLLTQFKPGDCLFMGSTGKIHVKIYKWNGNGFNTDENVQAFDFVHTTYGYGTDGRIWHDIDMPLGVKAAVGDFDGDGRDEIAVLRIMLQYSELYGLPSFQYSNFVFGAFVDLYTFDHGSIKPNYNAHSKGPNPANYGDNRNGWVGIRTTGMPMPWFTQVGISNYDPSQDNQNKIRKIYFLQPVTGEQNPYPAIDCEFDIIAGKFTGTIGKATTRDDLIIKYPQWTRFDESGNKLRSHVALMTNIPGVTNWGTAVHEITSLSERNYALAFAKADYLGEGISLGDPMKITDDTDRDYTAVLQMFPYHVDNLTEDGSALQEDPENFTLRLNTAITYSNTFTSADAANLTYSMTRVAETIFALDTPAMRTASKTFQGIRGILTAGIGSSDIIKGVSGIGEIWDKLKDTVETTTSKSNEHSDSYTMTIKTQANYQDTLYVNKSTRHIWRYPVLQVPAPAWIMGQTRDTTGSFDRSKVTSQRSYVTFAMSEPSRPVSSVGVNDSYYQPYHERGNLFSYPAALEQIEGYKGGKSIAQKGAREWDGANYQEVITLENTVTSQDQTKKVHKAGAITKFLSALDNLFGTSMAHIPQDSESTFTRSVTNSESISINIPESYSGAGFNVLFDTYLDEAGTMTTGFAVRDFNRDDALWGRNSLYSKLPDPSLLLPEKFNYSPTKGEWDRATFTTNKNDDTAMKMRGVRFFISDYDIETNNLLLKGLKYKITVPVYNASFVDADNVKVRLSYAKTSIYSEDKTPIGEYTFTKLPGWGNGNSRQTATFTWTPASTDQDGTYCLFAEIDPDGTLKEIHENRRNKSGDLIDAGGNNMGYWRIGIVDSNSPVLENDSELSAQKSEGTAFPYVNWVKADGLDLEDFIKQKVDGASEPVPVAVDLKYGGKYLIPGANLIGYKLKPEANGKFVSEITDADMELVFADLKFSLFPNDDHKLHFRINPEYLEDGIGFLLNVRGEEYALTDIIYGSSGSVARVEGVGSSSSGGCYSGFGLIALLGVLCLAPVVKKR